MYKWTYISSMPTKRYPVADARASLPRIVREAEAGHESVLMRRGKPVAVVLSLQEYERLRRGRPDFRRAYAGFLEKHPAKELGLDESFAEELRDKSAGRKVKL